MTLEGTRRQKSQQLELALEGRGEAPRVQCSGEVPTAASGDGRSGSDHRLMEVRKPTHDGASGASAANDQHPHAPAEQATVKGVHLHGSLLLSGVNELSKGLPRAS